MPQLSCGSCLLRICTALEHIQGLLVSNFDTVFQVDGDVIAQLFITYEWSDWYALGRSSVERSFRPKYLACSHASTGGTRRSGGYKVYMSRLSTAERVTTGASQPASRERASYRRNQPFEAGEKNSARFLQAALFQAACIRAPGTLSYSSISFPCSSNPIGMG